MTNASFKESNERKVVKEKLLENFQKFRPNTKIRGNYVRTNSDNLLSKVFEEEFRDDFFNGMGNELRNKFQAIHSSAALAVNNFAPFQCEKRIKDLKLLNYDNFNSLKFECRCSSGVRGCPPHIDVVVKGESKIIAIESKFTEYLSKPEIKFSNSYDKLNDDLGFYKVMRRIKDKVDNFDYKCLNVAQLIKHSFGIDRKFKDKDVIFLYLYWEPLNIGNFGLNSENLFFKHRSEISRFEDQVKDCRINFSSLSYNELWQNWRENCPNSWFVDHLNELVERYQISF